MHMTLIVPITLSLSRVFSKADSPEKTHRSVYYTVHALLLVPAIAIPRDDTVAVL